MRKLLYVEDEAVVAMSVVMALEDAGFGIVHVMNGAAAIAALQKGIDDYSGLLTDVRLPEVDGWLIARHARKMRADMPVVYVSGDSAADWEKNGVKDSVMLSKPVSNDQLVSTVLSVIGRA